MVNAGGSKPPELGDWRSTSQLPHSPAAESSSTDSPSPIAEFPPEMKGSSSQIRKRYSRKKPVNTGVWPCKINGCNKEFAREADLKRHQRTTKTHTMPSFSCPQCDASFTRTDALRRHQKSRHDGVILDPLEQSKESDENSQSSSPTSPSRKGKEKAGNILARNAQEQTNCERPASYYRAHTAMTTPFIPPQYHYLPSGTQITHPTSSTRTGPPWPAFFAQPTSYHPSPYYRPHTVAYSSSDPPIPEASSSTPPHSSTALSSDAHLDNIQTTKEITAEEVVAAVEAALLQTASKSQNDDTHSPVSSERTISLDNHDHSMDEGMSITLHSYGSPFAHHKPLDHFMTEDGEPMLNPAELLTQESLAESPPPC
ncbi:hypothetical protein CPB83DRAFT_888303 [Crepidotus variabilis]|uniref:C2H2-type domain-containing protein n=1 Tax=Crepidotus variabilis TaxID=179855 RepID=A0A9P6ESZ8_9AGAR|nr:hypothetical protein CPB83DRAFT_888303 [Crepidotus variabilis]